MRMKLGLSQKNVCPVGLLSRFFLIIQKFSNRKINNQFFNRLFLCKFCKKYRCRKIQLKNEKNMTVNY